MFKKLIKVFFLFFLTQNKKYFIQKPQEDQPPVITEKQIEFKKFTLFNLKDKTIDIIKTFGSECQGAGFHYDNLDCSDYPLIKGVAKSSILDLLNTFQIKVPEIIQRFLEKTTQLVYQINADDLTFSVSTIYNLYLNQLHENVQFNSLGLTFFHSSEDSNVEIDFRFILDEFDFSVAKWNNKTGFEHDIFVNFDKQIKIYNTEMQFNFSSCYSNNSTQCSSLPQMSGIAQGTISDILVALGHKELTPEQFKINNKMVSLFINYDSYRKSYTINSINQPDYQIGKTDSTDEIIFDDTTFSLTGTENNWHSVIKLQQMEGQNKIIMIASSDDGVKISELMDDGSKHNFNIGESMIELNKSESGSCQMFGINADELNCSKFPEVTFKSQQTIRDFIKMVGIENIPSWMEKPLTYLPELGLEFLLNFSTLTYEVDLQFIYNCKLDVEFLRQIVLDNLEFKLSGVKKDYKMFVALNSQIGGRDLVVKWLPKNDTVKYEVDLGKIGFGDMVSNMIPPVEDSTSVLNDFHTLEMEQTIMTVDPDVKNIKITSGLNVGANLEIDLRLKKEGKSSAIRVDFKKLEFLRPSLISNNLKFLDDYTAQMHDFKASTYDEDQGLTISGGFPMTNKIMKELVKIIPFRDDNGFMPFNLTAQNTQNFKIEIFLLANKQYDGWALKDNTLFFQSEKGIFQGGVSQILEVQVDDDTVDFKSIMELSEYQFSISAFLSSPWLHPFNCNKLDIYEAGAQVGITFEPFFSFAVDGKFKLVDTQFQFAVRFDPADVRNNAFFAEIDDLNFTTLIKGIKDVEIPSPLDQFTDNFRLNQGKMSIAGPEGVTLMDKHYDGGVSIALNATIFGKNFGGELTWNETILYLHGYSAPFVSNYFKFTAYQNQSKGPLLNMTIPFKADDKNNFAFLFDGEMQVLGVDIGAYSKIDKTGLVLIAKADVQPYKIELFNFNLNVTIPNIANDQHNYDKLRIHAQMLVPKDINDRIAQVTILLAKDINKAFYQAEHDVIVAKKSLEQAKNDVTQSQDDLKRQFDKQSQQLSHQKNAQIINENDKFYRDKNIATNQMENEKRRAKQQLDRAYSKCPKVWLIDIICKGLITAAQQTYNGIVSGAEITMQATMNNLAAAHQMKLRNINDLYDDGMRFAYAEYQTGVDTSIQIINEAQSLLDVANKALEIARKECGNDIPIISEIIQNFPIKLQEITFDAQAEDLTLDLLIVAQINKKLYTLSLDMNFKQNPDMILQSLAQQLWQNIKDNFTNNLLELNSQQEYISYLDNDFTEESFGILKQQQILY